MTLLVSIFILLFFSLFPLTIYCISRNIDQDDEFHDIDDFLPEILDHDGI